MTERYAQSADGSGIAQADNGAIATVNYSTHHHYAPESPRPTRAIHLNPPPALFIGREPELATLHQYLAREGSVVYIPGMAGRGKSTLANFYAHQHKDEYQSVHWLPCHSKSLVEIAAEFVWQLDLKLDGDLEANLKQLRAHCARNRCLLILDNVDDEAPAGMLLGGRSSVLLTTWHTNLKFLRPVPAIPLPVFTEDQCLELFRQKIGAHEVDRHLAESRLLFERLEHHPFALDIAAGLIREDRRYTIAGMAKKLPADIPALFAEAIATLSPEAQSLLAAMAACAPEGFRLSLAAEVAGFDEDAAFQALNQICSRSLAEELDRDTHRYRLHALVRIGAQPTDTDRSRHANAVRTQFNAWETDRCGCEEDMADWRAAFQWSLKRPKFWTSASELAYTGYRLTYRLGRLVEAHEIAVSMVEQARTMAADRRLQAWLGNQGLILQEWGRMDDAMALLKEQEALCVRLEHKAGLQQCYGNQALILRARGHLHNAMTLHKQEEALCIESSDNDGLQRSYGNQALILKAWGQLGNAMTLLIKQETFCIETGDQEVLQASYGNQAIILQDWGKLDEAMALLKKQEIICMAIGHKVGLQRSYGNQALILQDWGRLDEAMALLKQQEGLSHELGRKADLHASYGNQALILKAWGKLGDAMNLHKQEEALCIELGDSNGLGRSYGNQALILKAWGQIDDAMNLHKKEEALCFEAEDRAGLAVSYINQGLLARLKDDTKTEREKMQQSLFLFTELGMPREKEKVQRLLDRANGVPEPPSS